MKWAILAALVILLFLLVATSTESFTDQEFTNVTRPCVCSGPSCPSTCNAWESKVKSLAPMGASTASYISVLSAFYDTVYMPSETKPTEAQVATFLSSPAGTVAGVDVPAIKRILMDGFHIEASGTAASREDKTQMFKPSDANLAPDMGRDEVRTREEGGYKGANQVLSTKFSEGDYAPVTQTEPLHPGEWDDGTTQWKGPRPASVCPCAENVM
jgi:hypothetical protein